ncbi:YccF domain-containing protein [Salinifilum aidingensis]
MRLLLNLIWLVFGGLWLALGYGLAGILLCVTIIGIPLGIAAFRMTAFALWPFGKRLVDDPDAGAMSAVGNVVWFVLAGWWLALGHIATGVLMCVTIIGIPLGIANFKLVPVSLLPLGKRIVDSDSPYSFR